MTVRLVLLFFAFHIMFLSMSFGQLLGSSTIDAKKWSIDFPGDKVTLTKFSALSVSGGAAEPDHSYTLRLIERDAVVLQSASGTSTRNSTWSISLPAPGAGWAFSDNKRYFLRLHPAGSSDVDDVEEPINIYLANNN